MRRQLLTRCYGFSPRRAHNPRRRSHCRCSAGLKYDDILIESDPDIALATKRLPADELQARDRRLKRALDISFKKKPLPEEIQKTLTPLEPYMTTLLDEAKELRLERELLKGPR